MIFTSKKYFIQLIKQNGFCDWPRFRIHLSDEQAKIFERKGYKIHKGFEDDFWIHCEISKYSKFYLKSNEELLDGENVPEWDDYDTFELLFDNLSIVSLKVDAKSCRWNVRNKKGRLLVLKNLVVEFDGDVKEIINEPKNDIML